MAEKLSISDLSTCVTSDIPRGAKDQCDHVYREEIPKEGLCAWAAVVGGFMIYVAGLGYFNAYGVYQGTPIFLDCNSLSDFRTDFYVREFMPNKSPSEIAWIGSCQIALQFVLGLPVGNLFDRGYFHHLMIGGSFIYCFSLWILSLAKPNQFYLVFLTQGVGLGLGLGLTFLPALGLATQQFSRRRGLAIGIMTSGASIGGIIFPILLNNLLIRYGFAVAVRATAALVTGLMLLANLLMRTRHPKSQPVSRPSLHLILRDKPYMTFVAAGFFVMLGLFYPTFFLQLYSIRQGLSDKISFNTVSFINAGGVVGRLIPNFFADRVGSFNIIIPITFLATACILSMLAVVNSGGIIAISVLYGAMNAGFVSMAPALLVDLSNSRSEVGLRMGVWFSFTALAALAGQPLSGALIKGDFRWSTVFAGLCLCTGGCILILSRFLFIRRRRAAQSQRT